MMFENQKKGLIWNIEINFNLFKPLLKPFKNFWTCKVSVFNFKWHSEPLMKNFGTLNMV